MAPEALQEAEAISFMENHSTGNLAHASGNLAKPLERFHFTSFYLALTNWSRNTKLSSLAFLMAL
jgi:hypothetical protein